MFEKISQTDQRKWGKLDAHGMLVHIHTSIGISLEEIMVPDISNFFTRTILFRKMAFEIFSIPKGKIKAPDEFTPKPTQSFEEDKRILMDALARFTEEVEKNPDRIVVSPILGKIPLSYWAHIHGRHNSHHLEQFGLL